MTNHDRALAAVKAYAERNHVGSSLRNANTEGQPQGVVTDPRQMFGLHASSEILAKDIADILMKRYPGFRWAIQPNEIGGVFNIFCLDFHTVWGYVIRYADVMNDPKRAEAVKAARSILARFGYEGTRYDPGRMAKVLRDRQGNAIPDTSGLKPSRFTKKAELDRKLALGQAQVIRHERGGVVIQVQE